MRNFEFRKLFPISYYRFKNGSEFNAFLFWIDLVIWSVPLSILLTIAIFGLPR